MSAVFTYNQDQAIKAGASDYISESGAYVGKLSAKWTHGSNGSQSEALELSLTSADGKANYLSIWFKKKDGTDSPSGIAMINAIMGITRVGSLSPVQSGNEYICPELEGKEVGLVLQKVLSNKQNGDETYKFDIKIPFHPQTRQTLKELVEKSPAVAVDTVLSALKDRDERKKQPGGYNQYNQQAQQPVYQGEELENIGW